MSTPTYILMAECLVKDMTSSGLFLIKCSYYLVFLMLVCASVSQNFFLLNTNPAEHDSVAVL